MYSVLQTLGPPLQFVHIKMLIKCKTHWYLWNSATQMFLNRALIMPNLLHTRPAVAYKARVIQKLFLFPLLTVVELTYISIP